MKKLLPLLMMMVFSLSAVASTSSSAWLSVFDSEPESKEFVQEMPEMSMKEFLQLTPRQIEELTGRKLTIAETMKLKAAQRILKKKLADPKDDLDKTVYIVLAIVGLGFVGIGLLDDWQGSDWIIALVLSLLCWLPGVIYALVKMKNYY